MASIEIEKEVDVIVLGYGAAGGTAALTAAKEGAETLIVEKAPKPGGNSLVSSAMMIYPVDFNQKEQFIDYLHEVSHDTTPKPLIETFVNGLQQNPAWFESLGGELEVYDYKRADPTISYYIPDKTFPQVPSAKGMKFELRRLKQSDVTPEPTGGARVWNLINKHVQQQNNIEVWTDTPALEIVKNTLGQAIGVFVERSGRKVFCKARKGVIMTCGGFENDPEMKKQYLQPQKIGFSGSPYNTGDGVRLAQKVGADLWHMQAEASAIGMKPKGYEAGFVLTVRRPGFIYVDSLGDRFTNEARLEAHNAGVEVGVFNLQAYDFTRLPAYLIMDEENGKGKPLAMDIFSYNVVVGGYKWSENNQVEIDKGWIKVAHNLEELGEITGAKGAVGDTLMRYNRDARDGVDREFGRPIETLKPIEPPYYVIELEPLMYNTQGGPRRDTSARVLDPDGKVIPNLYAAGECGSIWGFRYQTSTNFSETIVYGRIAGSEAANQSDIEVFDSPQLQQ